MPKVSKLALTASRWAFEGARVSDLEFLGAAQKIERVLYSIGLGLTPQELIVVDQVANAIVREGELDTLVCKAERGGDSLEEAFRRPNVPFGRRVLIVTALTRAIDEQLARCVEGGAAVAAIKELYPSDGPATTPPRRKMARGNESGVVEMTSATQATLAGAVCQGEYFDPGSDIASATGKATLELQEEVAAAVFEIAQGPIVNDENNQQHASPREDETRVASPSIPLKLRDPHLEIIETRKSELPLRADADDFDPEQSADHWAPHPNAKVLERNGVRYYSGQGALRHEPPAGSGPVRLLRGYRWYHSRQDGLWHDETRDEWQQRADEAMRAYYSAFDDVNAPAVVNPVPTRARGYAGPGQTFESLQQLAKILRPAGPYQVFVFAPEAASAIFGGEARSFKFRNVDTLPDRDYLAVWVNLPQHITGTRPAVQLFASMNPTHDNEWRDRPEIDEPEVIGFAPSQSALPPRLPESGRSPSEMEEPIYAASAKQLGRNRIVDAPKPQTDAEDPDTLVLRGFNWVFSGPNGSGKSHKLMELAGKIGTKAQRLDRNQQLFFLNMRVPNPGEHSQWYSLAEFASLISAANDAMMKGNRTVLVCDEYAELTPDHLAQFGIFHQVLCAGDYAQGIHHAQPIFDFIWRSGGGSSVLEHVWRSGLLGLFDPLSCLAYDGLYVSAPRPVRLSSADAPAIVVSYCPDDPEAEAVALYAAASRNLSLQTVTIVVDGEAATKAINAIAFHKDQTDTGEEICRARQKDLRIISSHELRGHETGVIIVATAALDRAHLPTSVLMERLIVILGRAKRMVEFILPIGETVGSDARRFSCLVQPLVSVRVIPPELDEPDIPGFAACLAAKGFILKMLEAGRYICYRPDPLWPVMIVAKGYTSSINDQTAKHKGWTFREVEPRLLNLSKEPLESDFVFNNLLRDLKY